MQSSADDRTKILVNQVTLHLVAMKTLKLSRMALLKVKVYIHNS